MHPLMVQGALVLGVGLVAWALKPGDNEHAESGTDGSDRNGGDPGSQLHPAGAESDGSGRLIAPPAKDAKGDTIIHIHGNEVTRDDAKSKDTVADGDSTGDDHASQQHTATDGGETERLDGDDGDNTAT